MVMPVGFGKQPLTVKLKARRFDDPNDFGYLVALASPWAPGSRVKVDIMNQGGVIDVSHRPHTDLIGPAELPRLLAVLASMERWGRTATLQVWIHDRSGNVTNRLGPVDFLAPVTPLMAPRWPGMAATERNSLIYTKPPGDGYDGSFLWQNDIDGRAYFMHAGKFVIDQKERGFDCITYCGSVFGADARSGAMAVRGDELAQKLGLVVCGMEGLSRDEIRWKLLVNMTGTYLVWCGKHTVLCHNGVIHEFSESNRGYVETNVEDWAFPGSPWTARKSLKAFPKTARRDKPTMPTLMPGQAIV